MANLNKSPLVGGLRTKNAENVSDPAMRKNNSNRTVVTKIFGALFALCLIGMSAWNVTLNPLPKSGQSDINLATIEAMAAGNESSESGNGSETGNGSEYGNGAESGGGIDYSKPCDQLPNNANGGNIYLYCDLGPGPDKCTLKKFMDAKGNVKWAESEGGVGAGFTWTNETAPGIQELCPKKGKGCTVYSCHQTTNIK